MQCGCGEDASEVVCDVSVASRIGPSCRVKKDYTPVEGAADAEFDQCTFLNYHKAKRRKPWRPLKVIRAAAGPHDLPRPPSSSGSGSSASNSSQYSSPMEELMLQHVRDMASLTFLPNI